MDYRKPTKKAIVEAVVGVLKERGSVDTQTKMHRKVLEKLKDKDSTYKLSAERMRIIAILSRKVKVNIIFFIIIFLIYKFKCLSISSISI